VGRRAEKRSTYRSGRRRHVATVRPVVTIGFRIGRATLAPPAPARPALKVQFPSHQLPS